jgi:hypothetical protein
VREPADVSTRDGNLGVGAKAAIGVLLRPEPVFAGVRDDLLA